MSDANGIDIPSLLVVDDEPRNCRLLEGYLKSEGYRVRIAEDGKRALELAAEEAPDVVLLDVMMPGMSGHEVCRMLKGAPTTRLTQIMLVTALNGTPHQVEGLDTGADDYVSKPVRREEFLARVRSLLRARRLLLDLDRARGALAARNEELELKKTLAQTLVHDLKSPLSAVVGNLDLLEVHGDARTLDIVHRCKSGSSRMLRMIMDLLDVDALEDGRMKIRRDAIDTRWTIERAAQDAAAAARQRGVAVLAEVPEGTSEIDGDAGMLGRVLDNLLANAVAHSLSGGTVRVTARTRPEGIEIGVADQGPGVPEAQREQVFEKYARLQLREAGIHANRGLGLTFCRMAVEAHGGAIWIEDAPGGGARFVVILPAREKEHETEERGELAHTA